MEHFFPRIQVKYKKKVLHQKWNTFFSPNSSTNLRSDPHQSQIIGGDADENHTQIVGGYTVKLLGGILYPPSPPGIGTTDLGSTPTLVTLLRPWIQRFTMIISAWWFRTSSKFNGREFKEFTGTLDHWNLLCRCGFL